MWSTWVKEFKSLGRWSGKNKNKAESIGGVGGDHKLTGKKTQQDPKNIHTQIKENLKHSSHQVTGKNYGFN